MCAVPHADRPLLPADIPPDVSHVRFCCYNGPCGTTVMMLASAQMHHPRASLRWPMTKKDFDAACDWLERQFPNGRLFRRDFEAYLVNHCGPFQICERTVNRDIYMADQGYERAREVFHLKDLWADGEMLVGGAPDWLAEAALGQFNAPVIEERGQEECCICMAPLGSFKIIFQVAPCRHMFHGTCFASWVLQKRSCPLCRSGVETLDEVE